MINTTNSKRPVPIRGSAFNVKGFRKGVSYGYVRTVFNGLLPGSYIDLWEQKRGKQTHHYGRVSVTEAIMETYPEFCEALYNPGKSVPIEIGPFELMIWTKKPKVKRDRKALEDEVDELKIALNKQMQLQQETQVMLNNILVSNSSNFVCPNELNLMRGSRPSPPRKKAKANAKSDPMEMTSISDTETNAQINYFPESPSAKMSEYQLKMCAHLQKVLDEAGMGT